MQKIVLFNCQNNTNIQIVGMSATLPNVDELARWLTAELYITDHRPLPLDCYLKVDNRILRCPPPGDTSPPQTARELPPPPLFREGASSVRDHDHVGMLVWERARQGSSVLVFCATKQWCEKTAKHLSIVLQYYRKSTDGVAAEVEESMRTRRAAVLEALRMAAGQLCPTLAAGVPEGVAYHHAGLPSEERGILEDAYREGVLLVLCATSTLAVGVNLPVGRVILRSAQIGKEDLDACRFRQMAGRAGRKGFDMRGEAYIISTSKEYDKILRMLAEGVAPVRSCLTGQRLVRAILELLSCELACTKRDVFNGVFQYSLRSHQLNESRDGSSILHRDIQLACQYLFDHYLIQTHPPDNNNRQSHPVVEGTFPLSSPPPSHSRTLRSPHSLPAQTVAVASAGSGSTGSGGPLQSCVVASRFCDIPIHLGHGNELRAAAERSIAQMVDPAELRPSAVRPETLVKGYSHKQKDGNNGGEERVGECDSLGQRKVPMRQDIEQMEDDDAFCWTNIGVAVMEANMHPCEGLEVFADLFKALHLGLFVKNELHVLFLSTPVNLNLEPSWCPHYSQIYVNIDYRCKEVADFLGIRKDFITKTSLQPAAPSDLRALHANLMTHTVSAARMRREHILLTHRRFYAALLLLDLYNELPLTDIQQKYRVHAGVVEATRTQALLFAGTLSCFLQKLGPLWSALSDVLTGVSERLQRATSVPLAVQQLLQVEAVQPRRAQALVDSGLTDVKQLASSSVEDIVQALRSIDRYEHPRTEQEKLYVQLREQRRYAIAVRILRGAQEQLDREQQERVDATESQFC
eukprot:GHVS01048053.1.p1 GENE.GHVS01048053.1~~GHVS01048053.1.p1  ORF type:complete len:806 (+),score=136.38 GHVS01048053.1:291-2708(+)